MAENPMKYHKPAHYAAILRDRATIERTKNAVNGKTDDKYNGLAANFDAAANVIDIQAGKIVALEVLNKFFKQALENIALQESGESRLIAGDALSKAIQLQHKED